MLEVLEVVAIGVVAVGVVAVNVVELLSLLEVFATNASIGTNKTLIALFVATDVFSGAFATTEVSIGKNGFGAVSCACDTAHDATKLAAAQKIARA